jgi:hypothetical protein
MGPLLFGVSLNLPIKDSFEYIEKPCYFYNNMPRISSIQWKALLMLMSFTVSFTVFCHCACTAAAGALNTSSCGHHHSTCCKKRSPKQSDKGGCQGMQAVRFNLLEKQTAEPVHPAPTPLTALVLWNEQPATIALPQTEKRKLPQQWSYKHSPPNRLSLYQCFLI